MANAALSNIIEEWVAESRTFDVPEVLQELKFRANLDDGMSSMLAGAVRWELVRSYEAGKMIGYIINTRYSIGKDDRMYSALEFKPLKPINISDVMSPPKDPIKVNCSIEKHYDNEIDMLSRKYDVAKDVILRALILRSLEFIEEDL